MKNTLLTTFFLIITISVMTAQRFLPAEIYTIDGKTTTGVIKKSNAVKYSRSIEFESTDDGVLKMYQPKDLRGFKINELASYESATVQLNDAIEKTAFLQILVDGNTNLYRLEVDAATAEKTNNQAVFCILLGVAF